MFVVLDKSFLVSVPRKDLVELAANDLFVATGPLVCELFKHLVPCADNPSDELALCLNGMSKFSNCDMPLVMFNDVALVDAELQNLKPSEPLGSREVDLIHFPSDREIALSPLEIGALNDWQDWVNGICARVRRLLIKYSLIREWIPELKAPGLDADHAARVVRQHLPILRQRIASDVDFVLEQYSQFMRPANYPSAQVLNPSWLFYRQIQLELLLHLELYEKYMHFDIEVLEKRDITNDVVDYIYCMSAAHLGGFATCDKRNRDRFKLLCPEGLLLFWNGKSRQVERSP